MVEANIETGRAARDGIKQCGAHNCANDLGNNIRGDLASRKPPTGCQSNSHSGIDMAAGDMTNCISHCEQGKTECKRYANKTDSNVREFGPAFYRSRVSSFCSTSWPWLRRLRPGALIA